MPLDAAWESCLTMGTQRQYKPTNDAYKTGAQLLALLIETRAKGGNLLLNIGPNGPAAGYGSVFAAKGMKAIVALDLDTGEERWTASSPTPRRRA